MCCGPCKSVGSGTSSPVVAPRTSVSPRSAPIAAQPVDLGVQAQVEKTQARAEEEALRNVLFGSVFQSYRRPLVAL